MSREVDERIVAMYFDNKNFEQNAAKTIKTLETLKQSANMEGMGKGFEVLDKFGKTSNFDKINQSASKLKTTLSSFGDIIRKAFSMTPLDNLYRGLENFKTNYFDRMIGFDIAGKLASSFESAIRSLTIAPISAGWGQYENTMDSVKTIMSSTGETIEAVKEELAGLTDYANKTIYSLNDMTSNIGKFTNNGVKLKDATNAMIGLANATADAGQGAQQASMAMYNMSQAIGVGKMTTIDWKSFENANIATKKLKQVCIDAAVASGTLEKKVKKTKDAVSGLEKEEVSYWTKAEKGSKSVQVSFENFRDTLNKDWLTKDALLKTMGIFSGQLSVDEIAAMGFSKEESARLHEIGIEAMNAAQEVRTFSKMMDALREGVQSTWAESFQYIFGDMSEGTNLWTQINEKIEAVLNKGAKARNDILMDWRGMMRDENGNVRKIEDVYKARMAAIQYDYEQGYISLQDYQERIRIVEETLGNTAMWTDYREIAIGTLMEIMNIMQDIGSVAGDAWTNVFGEFTSDTLKNITYDVANFVDNIRGWLGDSNNTESRISKIRRGLEGVFSVLKSVWSVVEGIFSLGWQAVIQPLLDPVLNLFAAIGDFLNLGQAKNLGDIFKTLGKRIGEFWDKIKNWDFNGSISRIGTWFSNIWNDMRTGLSTWFSDNGLDGVAEWFTHVGDKIAEGYRTFSKWWNEDSGIPDFFAGIWESVAGVFKEGMDDQGNPVDAPIVQFFKNIGSAIEGAWTNVSGLPIWGQIGSFFSNLWEDVTGLFKPKDLYDDRGFKLNKQGDSPIVAFFKGIGDAVEDAWKGVTDLPIWKTLGTFFTNLWNDVTGLFQPKDLYDDRGFKLNKQGDSPIVAFFKDIGKSVEGAWQEVEHLEIWNTLGTFFSNLWKDVTGWFEPKVIQGKMGNTWTEDSPIVAFFKGIGDGVQSAYNEVAKWWETSGIPEFFQGIFNEVSKAFATEDEKGNPQEAPIVTFFKGIKEGLDSAFADIVGWSGWAAIGNFFVNTWDWMIGLFRGDELSTGGKEVADNAKDAEGIAKGLEQVVAEANRMDEAAGDIPQEPTIFQKIGGFFEKLFGSVGDFISQIGDIPNVEQLLDKIEKLFEVISKIMGAAIDLVYRLVTRDYAIKDAQGNPIKDADGNVMQNYGQIFLDHFIATLGVIAVIASKVSEARKLTKLTAIAEANSGMNNLGMQILEIAGAVLLITYAVEKLGALPLDQLVKGEAAVAVIGVAIGFIMKMITALRGSGLDKEPEKAWERVVGKLIGFAGIAGILYVAMEQLPKIIEAISQANGLGSFVGDDVLKTLTGLMLMIGGLMVAMTAAMSIAPSGGLDPLSTAKTVGSALLAFAMIAGTLYMGGGILGYLGSNPDKVKDDLAIVTAFMEGLGDAISGLFRGLLGTTHVEGMADEQAEKNIEHTKEMLEFLSGMSDTFNSNDLTSISNLMSTITDMTGMAKDFNSMDFLNFAAGMEHLVDGLLNIQNLFTGKYKMVSTENGPKLEYFQGIYERGSQQYENLMGGIDLIKQLFNAIVPMENLPDSESALNGYTRWFRSNFGEDGEGATMFIEGMNKIIDAAGDLHDGSGIEFDGIMIVTKFYEAIQDAFNVANEESGAIPKFDATPIVNSILDSLLVGESTIKEAVKRMVQAGVDLLAKENSSGKVYDFSQIIGSVNYDDFLENLSSVANSDTWNNIIGSVTGYEDQLTGAIEKGQEAIEQNYGDQGGLGIKVSGLYLDENFMTNLEAQMTALQTELDTNDDYTLELRPVFKTDGVGDEISSLSEFINGTIPIKFDTASINLSETPLLIDDSSILGKMDSLRAELAMTRAALKSAVDTASMQIASRISGLGSSFRGMSVKIDGKALVGAISDEMDNALGEAVGEING